MPTEQYVQHDWSPLQWAEMLSVTALLVVAGLCLFLLVATRQQRAHAPRGTAAPGTRERPGLDDRAERLARL